MNINKLILILVLASLTITSVVACNTQQQCCINETNYYTTVNNGGGSGFSLSSFNKQLNANTKQANTTFNILDNRFVNETTLKEQVELLNDRLDRIEIMTRFLIHNVTSISEQNIRDFSLFIKSARTHSRVNMSSDVFINVDEFGYRGIAINHYNNTMNIEFGDDFSFLFE